MKERKTILVTGAASGIGKATAFHFAKRGWFVGLFDMNKQGLEAVARSIGTEACSWHVADVTDPDRVKHAVEAFSRDSGGKLHVLFNNAGILRFGRFENVALDEHLRVVDVNLKGVIITTHACLEFLRHTPGARIITMASASSLYGIPELSVYSATKRAVYALTEAWDLELAEAGIDVCDIAAPYVRTPMILEAPERAFSVAKLGVDLAPEAVARAVWRAAHGKGLHYKVGLKTRLLFALFPFVPFGRRAIVRSLTMEKRGK